MSVRPEGRDVLSWAHAASGGAKPSRVAMLDWTQRRRGKSRRSWAQQSDACARFGRGGRPQALCSNSRSGLIIWVAPVWGAWGPGSKGFPWMEGLKINMCLLHLTRALRRHAGAAPCGGCSPSSCLPRALQHELLVVHCYSAAGVLAACRASCCSGHLFTMGRRGAGGPAGLLIVLVRRCCVLGRAPSRLRGCQQAAREPAHPRSPRALSCRPWRRASALSQAL